MLDSHGYLIAFIISLISVLYIRSLFSSSRSKSRLPPIPFTIPIIGHLHLLSGRQLPHQVLYNLSAQYGPVFRLFLGSVPCLFVSSSEMAKEILKTHETCYLNRSPNSIVAYLTYGSKDLILAPYGPYSKLMKKLAMSEILNGRTLDLLLHVRQDETNLLVNSLSQKAKLGKPVNVKAELLKLTNNVISRMIMSKRWYSDDESAETETSKLVSDITELSGRVNFADYIWFCKNLDLQGFGKRAKVLHQRFDELMERIISEHEDENRKKDDVKDLLDILLKISEDDTMEIKLTKDNIKAFIMDLFIAGTDTSALTMEWALAELINNPRIMKKAVDEIDRVVGKTRLLEEYDIPNLPYLQAIVKETLRLHPSFSVYPRVSTADCTVGGYHVPAKTTVYINAWALGRDPANWDNPLEFNPERFEESVVDVNGQDFKMLPFGSGRRMCPGTLLAMRIIPVTLGLMIQCFEWKAGEKGVDMEERHGASLARANPFVCVPIVKLDSII